MADEYRVVIDEYEQKDIDDVTVVCESAPDAAMMPEEIEGELRKKLKKTMNLTFRVEIMEYENLDRFELKADRLTDNRSNHARQH